ncbi:thiol peroxidase (atypical 2-Cys peroxiredoxin) [Carnobacterium iners]|uniref:Thiol peroxidase (Atypical 2-Cys peroxiredoxin) n=1 Tax=Carnobacterium iners TaxID=1073423 RepID=A0A1X7NMT7_9LACT|nr:thiol peroxidase [Carnobacterium iners]SEK31723.1 thiol peroxidase (atypical 2-Cys peroxiredoxin) [Carnobacterium iners]SMH39218.1 thiol peroxidase (atypical 2-Cys peroxiredoxin) [Carnobacterium iners]
MEFTKKGKLLKIEGTQPNIGEMVPNFFVRNKNDETISLENCQGEITLISVVPDIDTRVCAVQTKAFNKNVSELEGINLITISTNTKDEQENWCAGEGIDMEMFRDVDLSFGKMYGIAIPELNVLARSVFIIDATGKLIYKEVVSEMSDEPNYDKAIESAKAVR